MPLPTTREDYDKRRSEIDHYENVDMPRIAQLIAEARAEGDLKENTEYHAQRENQGMLQARINMLKAQLSDCYIVDKDSLPKGIVVFGAKVTVKDLDEGITEQFELVGPGGEDYSGEVQRILCDSPMAKQLLNHKVGDKVDIDAPGGKIRYEIKKIEN
ncbi:MAG: GreA/GreB family elongation factor [Planctomycetia bacterium]